MEPEGNWEGLEAAPQPVRVGEEGVMVEEEVAPASHTTVLVALIVFDSSLCAELCSSMLRSFLFALQRCLFRWRLVSFLF